MAGADERQQWHLVQSGASNLAKAAAVRAFSHALGLITVAGFGFAYLVWQWGWILTAIAAGLWVTALLRIADAPDRTGAKLYALASAGLVLVLPLWSLVLFAQTSLRFLGEAGEPLPIVGLLAGLCDLGAVACVALVAWRFEGGRSALPKVALGVAGGAALIEILLFTGLIDGQALRALFRLALLALDVGVLVWARETAQRPPGQNG
jgi:hypothetical protein